MNREIKYRAFDDGLMIYSDQFSHDEDYCVWDYLRFFFEKIRDDAKVMQFTGLKDKNGKEIYEGDVLGCITDFFSGEIHTLGVVKWYPELCGFAIEAKLFKDDEGYTMTVYSTQENSADGNKQMKREVLGNIYENPDLLPVPFQGDTNQK